MLLAHDGEKLDTTQLQATDVRLNHWVHAEVFSWQWWFLVVLMIIPWLLWIKLSDKSRLTELLLYGTILSYLVTVLDATGTELHIWSYTYKLIPLYNRLLPVDAALLPVTYMLVYQWFRRWKSYLIAHGIVALGATFVAEPAFVWMRIYNPHHWKHIYSFPVYLLLAVLMKWLIMKFKDLESIHKM